MIKEHPVSSKWVDGKSTKEMEALMQPIGKHKKNTKFIKGSAKIMLKEHGGEVPKDYDALMDLLGVGPKIAELTMQSCFGVAKHVAVDVHVRKISSATKLVRTKSRYAKYVSAEVVQKDLEFCLPKILFPMINPLMGGLGQLMKENPVAVAKTAKELGHSLVSIVSQIKKMY